MLNIFTRTIIFFLLLSTYSSADYIKKITIEGNQRVSKESIIIFSDIPKNKIINDNDINLILNNLYDTGFFKDISLDFKNSVLKISLTENPIIENLFIKGIKNKKTLNIIKDNLLLKDRSSYNESTLKRDINFTLNGLKDLGYYFASIKSTSVSLGNNKIDLTYDIDLGDKAIIKKISFIGDKFFKDRKLESVIISEESKFWKILSKKKIINDDLINFDRQLLSNFYKNKGFYNVKINSSYVKYLEKNKFELIYNINSNEIFYFNDLKLTLPNDYDLVNFEGLISILNELKGKPYSLNSINYILKEIDNITLFKEYEFLKATVKETFKDNQINLEFVIEETSKSYVEKINILGNNVTHESVIRNYFLVDEGDAFNEILHTRSINNVRSLNFFKSVKSKIKDGSSSNQKIIDILVEEKPTGEISAGAGVGTNGGTLGFQITENNFLGRGIEFATDLSLSAESIKGKFAFDNPNFYGSDRNLNFSVESSETDRLTNFGYKSNKTGFEIGTGYKAYQNLFLRSSISTYYESIKTNSTASISRQKQKGNFFDTFINYGLDYDKRDQKFDTTSGFRSRFNQNIPIFSESNSLLSFYDYKIYKSLLNESIGTAGLYVGVAKSISNKNIKLSDRLFLPANKLRGFERGKVGPVDDKDHIGGNYAASINFAASLPGIMSNSQNTDFSLFLDAANIWGVDYDDTVNNSNTIRSSIGIAVDWTTPIGPLNFSLSENITKNNTDITEFFRFNLGTTF